MDGDPSMVIVVLGATLSCSVNVGGGSAGAWASNRDSDLNACTGIVARALIRASIARDGLRRGFMAIPRGR
jgi:hypothetical protein